MDWNWVILASRFPVRIEIQERDIGHPLRMGMTAFVTLRDSPAKIPALTPANGQEAAKARPPQ